MKRRGFLTSLSALLLAPLRALAETADPPPLPVPDPPPMPVAPVKPAPAPAATVTSYRRPVGHTHTCAAGHTWDHAVTPGHNCPTCGRQQFVQDNPPRLVPVTTTTAATPAATPASEPAPTIQYTLPGSTSGCGPAGCPAPQTAPRRDLFRR